MTRIPLTEDNIVNSTYTIRISEEQRAILERALLLYVDQTAAGPDVEEARVMHQLFVELPESEIDMQRQYGHAPGTTTHGFSL